MPLLNAAASRVRSFIEKFIVDVPEEKKSAFKEEICDLIVDLAEAAAKGAVEGAKE